MDDLNNPPRTAEDERHAAEMTMLEVGLGEVVVGAFQTAAGAAELVVDPDAGMADIAAGGSRMETGQTAINIVANQVSADAQYDRTPHEPQTTMGPNTGQGSGLPEPPEWPDYDIPPVPYIPEPPVGD